MHFQDSWQLIFFLLRMLSRTHCYPTWSSVFDEKRTERRGFIWWNRRRRELTASTPVFYQWRQMKWVCTCNGILDSFIQSKLGKIRNNDIRVPQCIFKIPDNWFFFFWECFPEPIVIHTTNPSNCLKRKCRRLHTIWNMSHATHVCTTFLLLVYRLHTCTLNYKTLVLKMPSDRLRC